MALHEFYAHAKKGYQSSGSQPTENPHVCPDWHSIEIGPGGPEKPLVSFQRTRLSIARLSVSKRRANLKCFRTLSLSLAFTVTKKTNCVHTFQENAHFWHPIDSQIDTKTRDSTVNDTLIFC